MNFAWRTKCNLCKKDKSDVETRRRYSRSSSRSRSRNKNHKTSPAKDRPMYRNSLSPRRDKKIKNRGDSMEELFSSNSSSRERRRRLNKSREKRSLSRSLSPIINTRDTQDEDFNKQIGESNL